jgi:hypothetical protein
MLRCEKEAAARAAKKANAEYKAQKIVDAAVAPSKKRKGKEPVAGPSSKKKKKSSPPRAIPSPPAARSEHSEANEDEDDEEPPPSFEYRINLCCRKGKEVDETLWNVNSHQPMASKVEKWINDSIRTMKGAFVSAKLIAAYGSLAVNAHARQTWRQAEDWLVIFESLIQYYNDGKKQIRVHVDVELEPSLALTQQTPARKDATTIHLNGLKSAQAGLVAAGNFTEAITRRWGCSNGGCKNKGQTCFVAGRDEPCNHFPVYGPILMAWQKAIGTKDLTEEEPGFDIRRQLIEAKISGGFNTNSVEAL